MMKSNKNVNTTLLFAQFAVASIQQIFRVRVEMDSLQHEACHEIDGLGAFDYHKIFTFLFTGHLTSRPQLTPLATR